MIKYMKHIYREEYGLFTSEMASAGSKLVKKPCLFLDRDGVVIEEKHYLSKAKDVCIISGAEESILRAAKAGYRVVLITNQSGIARGIFGWEDYILITEQMIRLLGESGKYIDCIFACPMHEQAKIDKYRIKEHIMRKPNKGMIDFTFKNYSTSIEESILVGDKICDIQAGIISKIPNLYHVLTGHGKDHRDKVCKLSYDTESTRINKINSIKDLKKVFSLTKSNP